MACQAKRYLRGLFQAKRRNMERMAEEVEGADAQQLHHFNGNSPWRARRVYDQVASEASVLLGGQPNSCLLLDETGFIKKGKHSVGAARQYIGRIGKIDNGQVAVFATLSNGTHHTIIDTRLYLPKEWTDDPARCKKSGVPHGKIVFRSKAQLALAMIRHARANGIRYNWVGMDGGYGKEPWLLRALDADGEIFVADVHKDQRIYLTDPGPHILQKRPAAVRPAATRRRSPSRSRTGSRSGPNTPGAPSLCGTAPGENSKSKSCIAGYGYGTAKKKRRISGISSSAGNRAHQTP